MFDHRGNHLFTSICSIINYVTLFGFINRVKPAKMHVNEAGTAGFIQHPGRDFLLIYRHPAGSWIQIRSIEASFMPVSLYPIFCSRISTSMTFGFRQFLRTCSAELRSAVTIELHQLILRNYSSQCLICLRIRTYIVNMYNDVARPLPDALSCALSPFLTALRPAVWDTPADGMADTAMTLSCKSARNGDTDYGFSNISTWADRNHG